MMRGRLRGGLRARTTACRWRRRIIPAADVSVQISTAGKEASGTSNMKFALNGALTIGTLDGANIEIREAVGPENFFLFGLTTPEVAALRTTGYDPMRYIRRARRSARPWTDRLGLLQPRGPGPLQADRRQPARPTTTYMVCADFDAYVAAEAQAAQRYQDPREWARRSLFNIVGGRRLLQRQHHPPVRRARSGASSR